MAADLRFVPHAAQAHAHEFAARGLGDGLAERGLAHARRSHQAQDRSLHLADALLHRQIFKDAFLDLLQTVMIVVEHTLGGVDVLLDLGSSCPRAATAASRDSCAPPWLRPTSGDIERSFLTSACAFSRASLLKLGLADALFQLVHLVAAFFAFAEFLLDRLQLLVEIIFALGLLHLALDARTDLALDLQHADLALDQGENLLQPLGGVEASPASAGDRRS